MGMEKVFIAAVIGYIVNIFLSSLILPMITSLIPLPDIPFLYIILQAAIFGAVVVVIFKLLKGSAI